MPKPLSPGTANVLDKAGLLGPDGRPVSGVRGLAQAQWDAGRYYANAAADAAGKALPGSGAAAGAARGLTKGAFKAVPVLGSLYAATQAFRDFKDGDYIGAALNTVGVIPGPVGWVAIGAGALWDTFSSGGVGEWDAPNGTTTQMLPGTASEISGVTDTDAALTAAQRGVFSFQDGPNGTVWNSSPPEPLRIDTPAVKTAVATWLNGIADHFATVDKTMASSSEPYIQEYRAKLAPHFAAMAALPELAPKIVAQLSASSDAAAEAYRAVLAANHATRLQLAENGALSDSGPATTLRTELGNASARIAAADDTLAKLAPVAAAVLAPVYGTTSPRGLDKADTVSSTAPVTTTPTAPVAPAPARDTGAPKEDLSKLLSSLGNKTGSGSPLGSGLGGSPGGGTPLGSPMGGGAPGGTPLAGPTTTPKSEGRKLDDGRDRDRKKSETAKLSAPRPDNAAASVPVTPTTAVPAAAGTAAPGPGQPAAKPAAEASTEVDVKGEKVKFPDAKTAKLGHLLGAAGPNNPMSLSDAAAQAGLTPPVPGQDPGRQIAPVDAKPGDVLVAGEKQYMVLGDGKFYDLSAFQVVDADMLPKDLGDRAGYFRLGDPGEGGPGGNGPVSGQTPDAVAFDVPNPDAPATAPTDASPGAPPTPTAPPAASPEAVPASGTPGMPKQAESGGPANAASTDTGIGEQLPSANAQSLDPSAVK
ncbi:hypothetical protein [Mycolicibacterium sp.]|uniref:hypothetical protein n=1 Tax=Mycolicibacterium sp. TaxID=2320850 RepID=UPI0035603833